ncbi:apolipoprotein A-V-like [Anolis sagrei]|uniref:apolipoprotein A-V-like n=1 Tax=Anolis sagrei TaxID=38937 RepID=UPI00352175D8
MHPRDPGKRRQQTPGKQSPRTAMMPGVALLTAFLLAFSASQAGPLLSSSGDDARQLTRDKDAAEEAQRLKLAQRTPNLKDRLQDGDGHPMSYLLEKLSVLTGGLQPLSYQDARSLRELIGREMEGLHTKISPYLGEEGQQVGQALDDVRCCLVPVAEEVMSQVSLLTEELNQQLGLSSPSFDGVDVVAQQVAKDFSDMSEDEGFQSDGSVNGRRDTGS